jgi:exodeoxyribonuclease VIII
MMPASIVHGMPAHEYHASAAVSNSMLSAMAKSPAHYYALHLAPGRPERQQTSAMAFGSFVHSMILEPDTLSSRYIAKPAGMSFARKDGMAWRDAVPQGISIIDAEDWARADAMRDAVMSVPALAELLSSGVAESSVFWRDASTGLECRCRPDWLRGTSPSTAIALDLKTIDDLTLPAVERAIERYGYHRQAAHYSAGLRAAGVDIEAFVFGFVSSSYPHIAAAFILDDETLAQADDEVASLLDRISLCMKSGQWPAFGDGLCMTGLPRWARTQQEIEVGYA